MTPVAQRAYSSLALVLVKDVFAVELAVVIHVVAAAELFASLIWKSASVHSEHALTLSEAAVAFSDRDSSF